MNQTISAETIDPLTLTPREARLHAAGYLEGVADRDAELQRADRYLEQTTAENARLTAELEQLRTELTRANDDADRYYRIAFNPRPTNQPIVPLRVRELQRDDLYNGNATITRTRRLVAA